ncbi:MAG: hypothetical protein COV45_00450 [Deltaproteobacteria bacterium CG11_big_fil_rev_8_21_14_0_20_47_16]|nr:MAG: hypothetical protein COV45_00450 [Deltaproteobacteria bacterium CG11_big_fil_rev_8_21_14_0_20_47_16]
MTTFDQRASDIGIEFAEPAPPAPHTARVVIYNKLAFISGALPVQDARLSQKGLVGTDVALVDKARNSAKQATVCALAMLREELGGSLNTVKQVIKLTGYVACTADFHEFDRLFDSASHLLHDLFGSSGRHARSIVGVAALAKSAPIMVDLVVALK